MFEYATPHCPRSAAPDRRSLLPHKAVKVGSLTSKRLWTFESVVT